MPDASRFLCRAVAFAALALVIATPAAADRLTDAEVENLVKRSAQYVALFNTINNFATNPDNPIATGGWNRTYRATALADASVRAIPRPNNDTLYVTSTLDLRDDAVVISYPAFQSKFVSLEVSALDHYVDIPLATSKGDFGRPTTVLFHSPRTDGYGGTPVAGVDRIVEMTGEIGVAFLRVMPEAQDPEKFEANMAAIAQVELQTLSEFLGEPPKPVTPLSVPAYRDDAFTYAKNFAQALQWVVDHTVFDPERDAMDRAALSAFARVGVGSGQAVDPDAPPAVEPERLALTAQRMYDEQVELWNDPARSAPFLNKVFQPKGAIDIDTMFVQSVVGPLGQPASQAMYPGVATADGAPMNALNDYVLRMTKDELPPARAFWSVTLYDSAQGYFIPNAANKYSVGQNAGMRLDADGGIEIHIAAERPDGVPPENWLPIPREDMGVDLILRIYQPDLERMKTWTAPHAEVVR